MWKLNEYFQTLKKNKTEMLYFMDPHWKNDEWKYVSKEQKRTEKKVIDKKSNSKQING